MTKQELKSLYWIRKEIQREKRILAEGRRMNELQSKYDAICAEIYAVKDSQVRLILLLRYVDGMSWRNIAARVGGGNSGDSCRKIADRFLCKK